MLNLVRVELSRQRTIVRSADQIARMSNFIFPLLFADDISKVSRVERNELLDQIASLYIPKEVNEYLSIAL